MPSVPGLALKVGLSASTAGSVTFSNTSRVYIGQLDSTLPVLIVTPNLSLQFNGVAIKSGNYAIPATKLFTIEIRDPNDIAGNSNVVSYGTVWLNSFTINATTATCTVNSNNLLVSLPRITANSTNNISLGSALFVRNFSINLTCPTTYGPNIYTTFTDNINPTNLTNILSLDPASSAQGIGIQIKYNNSPIKFGPDFDLPATTNQFLLKSNVNGPTTFNFAAQLIKTGVVSSGDYKATATFTLSYQ
ncbi:fimbrial protein [Aquitalea pelogenes]|uniref:fimbrial protein n=1 Tax=Aquitalea pelogenes TaxID=1293573 RepID=UPI001379F079|nr:fimbrial protein [Aquitalea pelogenes]